jgi:hypothetical protein
MVLNGYSGVVYHSINHTSIQVVHHGLTRLRNHIMSSTLHVFRRYLAMRFRDKPLCQVGEVKNHVNRIVYL